MEDMLVLDGLTKTYGDFYAAKEVTLKLKEGEFLTLLGHEKSVKAIFENIHIFDKQQ